MPLPQVNERIKEVPAQALRAVFAGIGQVLLVADKIRNRAVEQVSGAAATTAPAREAPAPEPAVKPTGGPSDQAKPSDRAKAADEAKPSDQAKAADEAKPSDGAKAGGGGKRAGGGKPGEPAGTRWRSLDETGNVRLIPESDEVAAAGASASAPDVSAPAPEIPAPAPDVTSPAPSATPDASVTAETPAGEIPADETPAGETVAQELHDRGGSAAADSRQSTAIKKADPAGLPLANYDELSIPSLRARMRVLSVEQVTTLLDYERASQARPAVITMFERRLAKLAEEAG